VNNTDLVSIVIPNKNHGIYLKSAIESILNQTYKNIEVIVVDAGSTDNSKLIAQQYEKVKFIHSNDRNSSHACWIGLSNTSGNYVMFLTSTDYLLDNRFIESSLDQMTSCQKVSLVYGNYCTDINGLISKPKKFFGKKSGFSSHEKLFMHWMSTRETFIEHTYLVRRNVLIECVGDENLYSKNFLELENDFLYDFKFNFMAKGYFSKYIKSNTFAFRIHENQISQTGSSILNLQKHMMSYVRNCDMFTHRIKGENKFIFIDSDANCIKETRIKLLILRLNILYFKFISKAMYLSWIRTA